MLSRKQRLARAPCRQGPPNLSKGCEASRALHRTISLGRQERSRAGSAPHTRRARPRSPPRTPKTPAAPEALHIFYSFPYGSLAVFQTYRAQPSRTAIPSSGHRNINIRTSRHDREAPPLPGTSAPVNAVRRVPCFRPFSCIDIDTRNVYDYILNFVEQFQHITRQICSPIAARP